MHLDFPYHVDGRGRSGQVGDEGYVRASIIDSNGFRGWTQPRFLTDQR